MVKFNFIFFYLYIFQYINTKKDKRIEQQSIISSTMMKDRTITFMEKQMIKYEISVAIFLLQQSIKKKCNNITKNHNFTDILIYYSYK